MPSSVLGGGGRLISAAPLRQEWSWGLLIERVEKVEGMRGRRRGAVYGLRIDACGMEALGKGSTVVDPG